MHGNAKKLIISIIGILITLCVAVSSVFAWFFLDEYIDRSIVMGSTAPDFTFTVQKYIKNETSGNMEFGNVIAKDNNGTYQIPIDQFSFINTTGSMYFKFNLTNTTSSHIFASIFYDLFEYTSVIYFENTNLQYTNVSREDILSFSTALISTGEPTPTDNTINWSAASVFSTQTDAANPNYVAGQGSAQTTRVAFFVIKDIPLAASGTDGDSATFYLKLDYNDDVIWEILKQNSDPLINAVCPVKIGGYATTGVLQ